jgi:hypothetical protein
MVRVVGVIRGVYQQRPRLLGVLGEAPGSD